VDALADEHILSTQQKPRRHKHENIMHSQQSEVLCDSIYGRAGLVGESLSSLCTSSLENVSAVSSLHSLAETMFLFSLALFRLIGSEHLGVPPLFYGWKQAAEATFRFTQ
jgi:hypothetical protein